MNKIDLNGRVAIVTGGARGIGRAIVERFLASGAKVAIWDTDTARTQRTLGELAAGAAVIGCDADITSEDSLRAALAATIKAFGRADILVNNAGIGGPNTTTWEYPTEEFRRVVEVDLVGVFLGCKVVVPHLIDNKYGRIVNVASVAGKRISFSGGASYTASKAGLLGFTRHAAFELGIHRIRVNAVCPGPTLTPMIERNLDAAQRKSVEAMVPLGRWVLPEDVAAAIVFLAGDGAAMCTGTSIDVDGGVLVSNGSPYREYFARRR